MRPVDRNIALLLTPAGTGAIAAVRLRGPRVKPFLESHFSKKPAIGRCVHGELRDADRVIDDPVVVLCDEQTADVNLHGGVFIVRSMLELARREGFEVLEHRTGAAAPPEAFDVGSELGLEVLAHLPLAQTELGVRMLLAQEQAWAQLKRRAASGEAGAALAELRDVLADAALRNMLDPPTVAIVGGANVGKSTLANQLFGQERSITADVPGTTRDWVGEIANLDGLPVMLVDTPGLRATDDEIERSAIEQSRPQVARASLVVLVLDATLPPGDEQFELVDRYAPPLLVVNKCDRRHAWNLHEIDAIRTIATTGAGVDELRKSIVRTLCGHAPIEVDRARCWTTRQREIVERAIRNADPRITGAL